MLGKTNTDEFAMGSSTENSGYFTTHNPWDLAAGARRQLGRLAARLCRLNWRWLRWAPTPAAVYACPPPTAAWSASSPPTAVSAAMGLIAYGSSLDQIGVLAKSVADAALVLQVIAGHDPCDSTSLDAPVPDYSAALTGDIRGLRVGLPKEYFIEGLQPEVKTAVEAAVAQLEALGAQVVPISLPNTDKALPVYYLVATAEASANLARFDGVRFGYSAHADSMFENFRQSRGEGFGPEVKRRIMLGTYALSAGYYDAYYLKAQQVRTLIKQDFERAFEAVDVIACPVAPTTAFRIGEKTDNPLEMYLMDVFTITLNLAGMCGISVPCGFDNGGLPIGLQLDRAAPGRRAHPAHRPCLRAGDRLAHVLGAGIKDIMRNLGGFGVGGLATASSRQFAGGTGPQAASGSSRQSQPAVNKRRPQTFGIYGPIQQQACIH